MTGLPFEFVAAIWTESMGTFFDFGAQRAKWMTAMRASIIVYLGRHFALLMYR